MPRYSILLPTRNGAALLEGSIRSVLDQPYDDFELIISDNASEDSTPEILERYATDPRVRLLRQDEPLGVTDNWNKALAVSTGDRLGLLGDDDLLLPGYFERLDALLERHADPEVLLYNAYAFAFPGFAGSQVSQYVDPFWVVTPPLTAEGDVSLEQRRAVVGHLFRFDFPVPLNMQTAVVARRAIAGLPDGLFKPPFPDFYALAGLMLTVDRWAVDMERLVVIGVSPKSFGRTVHSRESTGEARGYLGIDPRFPGQLPGSEVMNGHYETLLALAADFPQELAGFEIDRHEYAWQQAYSWYVQRRLGSLTTGDVLRRLRLLSPGDWSGLMGLFAKRLRPGALRRRVRLGGDAAVATLWPGMRPIPEVGDIVEFAAWIEARQPRPAQAAPRA
jgi:glycosyltransferase involved in cell wall biosynthesis